MFDRRHAATQRLQGDLMKCLVLSNELLFATQAAQAARDAGYTVQSAGDPSELNDFTAESLRDVRLVVADLTIAQLDAQEVALRLRGAIEPPPHLIAVGPHVQRARLDAAREAGWRVYTRGQFHSSAASILGGLASTT
jgi:CheY-like chemotaxis protein